MKILVTGSEGFIAGYLVKDLLDAGHTVIGIDNFSKYGKMTKEYHKNPKYFFFEGDAKDTKVMTSLMKECDMVVAGAAIIGGISLFHKLAYDLYAENERILASTFDAAIENFKAGTLKRIIVMSSSMVFESTDTWPSKEGDQFKIAPPMSTYGFQKLSAEYFAKGAWEQYKLPYTIIRPFNCVGTGEYRAAYDEVVYSGNVQLALSHVVPDLIQKVVKGQDPLHILGAGNQIRCYTFGADIARGIRMAIESDKAINEDFNISIEKGHTVLEIAELIWKKIHPDKPFGVISDKPFEYDVQKRIPDVSKAKEILGFEATTHIESVIDDLINWVTVQAKAGLI